MVCAWRAASRGWGPVWPGLVWGDSTRDFASFSGAVGAMGRIKPERARVVSPSHISSDPCACLIPASCPAKPQFPAQHVLHGARPSLIFDGAQNNAFAIANRLSVDLTTNTLTLTIPSVPADGSLPIGAEASASDSTTSTSTASGKFSASATGGAGGTGSASVNGMAFLTGSESGSGTVRPTSALLRLRFQLRFGLRAFLFRHRRPSSAARTRTLPAAAAAIAALVAAAFVL
ncbi:hypothetical protein DFH09DRAFT_1090344 [Mycena vulgaris]|nr:hypothetical protein DFH09DRAFT_1090344 [Mycena vulgaris]